MTDADKLLTLATWFDNFDDWREATNRIAPGIAEYRDVQADLRRIAATLATPTPDTLNAEARALAVVFAWKQQPAPDGTFEAGDQPTSYWRDRAEAVREALADD